MGRSTFTGSFPMQIILLKLRAVPNTNSAEETEKSIMADERPGEIARNWYIKSIYSTFMGRGRKDV